MLQLDSALPLNLKRRFLTLAVSMSPENLSRDGELRGAALSKRARELKAVWRDVENQAGLRVTEDEAWAWCDEIRDADKREAAEALARAESHPLLETYGPHSWRRLGGPTNTGSGDRWTAYYIHARPPEELDMGTHLLSIGGDPGYRLFSEFAYRLGPKEEIGVFPTLAAAVEAGEAYLKTVTASAWRAKHPAYREEYIAREFARLPPELQQAALAA